MGGVVDGCVYDTEGGGSVWPMDESVPLTLMCFIIQKGDSLSRIPGIC